MKLRRFFASFSLVLLLFSVFLVPCYADEAISSSDYALGIFFAPPGVSAADNCPAVYVPSAHEFGIYSMKISSASSSNPVYAYLQASSNFYKPATYDRTVYVTIGFCASSVANYPIYYFGNRTFDLLYMTEDGTNNITLSNAGRQSGYNFTNLSKMGDIATIALTIPANSTSFRFHTQDVLFWEITVPDTYTLTSYGAYIIDTADDAILNAIEQILAHTQSIDNNTGTMVVAINQILGQLRDLNADTDTIVSVLNTLQGLSESQLVQLEKISTSVDAIYFFLTEALKSDSEDASQAVQDTVNSIDNSHASEAYWQTSMQGNYDSLDLEHFSFGGITGGIELVGRIFTDMWSAFGEYQILFTFPLVLGIALLVIGRISKFGGGNSSRNKEHKGGEGGA